MPRGGGNPRGKNSRKTHMKPLPPRRFCPYNRYAVPNGVSSRNGSHDSAFLLSGTRGRKSAYLITTIEKDMLYGQ